MRTRWSSRATSIELDPKASTMICYHESASAIFSIGPASQDGQALILMEYFDESEARSPFLDLLRQVPEVSDNILIGTAELGFHGVEIRVHSDDGGWSSMRQHASSEYDGGYSLEAQLQILGKRSFEQRNATLYSGFMGRNFLLAQAASCADLYGPTIEETPGGQYLSAAIKMPLITPLGAAILQLRASEIYASSLSGHCNTFVAGSVRQRIFRDCELALLIRNPRILSINGVSISEITESSIEKVDLNILYESVVMAEFARDRRNNFDQSMVASALPTVGERLQAHEAMKKSESFISNNPRV